MQPKDSPGHTSFRWTSHLYPLQIWIVYCTNETTLPGLGMLWFDEVGIYNILYFSKIKEKHDVRYYRDENIFAVLKPMHEVLFNTRVGGI